MAGSFSPVNRIHFISGLPRSGSTLLSSILRQNPAFHATIMSPVGSLYQALESSMTPRNEANVLINPSQRRALLKGIFENYYFAAGPGTVIFDTNRMWCARMPALAGLFPEAKVICCVRNVSWIMDSFERQALRNPYELSGIFAYDSNFTVFTRMKRIAASEGPVGYALDALREACFGEFNDRLILVDYEALARAPASVMQHLYTLLGLPPFAHDFSNVGFDTPEFDRGIGAPGLHKVRERVEWRPRESVLPPDLFNSFANDAFWMKPHAKLDRIPKLLWLEKPGEASGASSVSGVSR